MVTKIYLSEYIGTLVLGIWNFQSIRLVSDHAKFDVYFFRTIFQSIHP